MTTARPPPDQAYRDAAVRARGVNVLVDAGAGTGKTTLLVHRLVDLVAPPDDGAALELGRVAAVTFTRKAAGELRLRVRECLFEELSGKTSPLRRDRLVAALVASDTAFISTIHGFCDRLLRMKPVAARLSPSYEVVENPDPLCREAYELLLQAVQAGKLADELADQRGVCTAEEAAEAEAAVSLALDAGVRAESQELEYFTRAGLDALFAGFILNRDVRPTIPALVPFPLTSVRAALEEFHAVAGKARGPGAGSQWIARALEDAAALASETHPATLYREITSIVRFAPSLKKRTDFPDDGGGWEAYKDRAALAAPLQRWMATWLVRAFPAVVAMYEKVKARRRTVDQVDLLLRLRNLLRDDRQARADLQARFDHVFVDEFQDTDPLQAEILFYLCEAGPAATAWTDVKLVPGKLTLVGDPKQSIYRFRRADIAVYEQVRTLVMQGPHLPVPLTANFRSEPSLIAHLNDRYDEILGSAAGGDPVFDSEKGTVANQRLDAGRCGGRPGTVRLLRYATEDGKVDPDRLREAEVLATWMRAAVEGGEAVEVSDSAGRSRRATYGDIAVLVHATTNAGLLIDALDRMGVPWSARGGKLFLEDPLHRQLLLALRAVADRQDGVAQAALLRAPFFALDLADLARERATRGGPMPAGFEESIGRAREALALLDELRRARLSRPPGETARDLLDRTGLARAVALGPNGGQRLDRLRELCFEVERLAVAEGLDYDGVTARMRSWALDPIGLDPPRPVGADAVQIMTVHQAKGLEFPVVVWWDARAEIAARNRASPWFVERSGQGWAMSLDGVEAEEPAGGGVLAREKAFADAERRRLVYVAGTRARDLLVLPLSAKSSDKHVAMLLAGEGSPSAVNGPAWTDRARPLWAKGEKPPPARKPMVGEKVAREVEQEWTEAAREAAKARLVPRGVSAEAHASASQARAGSPADDRPEGEAGARLKLRPSRFGAAFGETVHRAIGLALADPAVAPQEAVARIANSTGLAAHLDEASADVAQALSALGAMGLRRRPDDTLRLEYPVSAAHGELLLSGYIDLLAAEGGGLVVLDFKTDAPPESDVQTTHPDYVEQVRSYRRILADLGLAKAEAVRCGLLFTASGQVWWV